MASRTPQDKVFRLPLTPYVAWAREHPDMNQPTDERQYPSYPSHTPGNVMMRFCIRDRKWKPKSDFPQDPARPGYILLSKRGEPIKFCTRCTDYINQRALEKKDLAVRKPADPSGLRRKLQTGDGAARFLDQRLEENLRQRQRLDREVQENLEERRLLLVEMARLEGGGDVPEEEDDDREVGGGGSGRDDDDYDYDDDDDDDDDDDYENEDTGLPNIHENNSYHMGKQPHDEYLNAPPAIAAAAATATHQNSHPDDRNNTYTYTYTYTYPPPPTSTSTSTNNPPTPYPSSSSYDSYPVEPYGAHPHDQRPAMLSFENGTYRPLTPPAQRAARFALQDSRYRVLGSPGPNGACYLDEGADG